MGSKKLLLFLLLYWYVQPASAMEVWPQLVKNDDGDNIHCEEALKVAQSVFYSDFFNIYINTTPLMPKNINSVLVLEADGDLYYETIIVNPNIFEKIDQHTYNCDYLSESFIYWQRQPVNGIRLVFDSGWWGWRGLFCSVYALKEEVSIRDFLGEQTPCGCERVNSFRFTENVIIDGLQTPLILEDQTTKSLWMIDTLPQYAMIQENEKFLVRWAVYSIEKGQVNRHCTIHFRPQASTPEELLPKDVSRLSKLLYIALGKDNHPGSYDPFVYIKADVRNSWSNIAMRPWALTLKTCNTRKEVDIGLKKWAAKNKFNTKLYHDILKQYKKALPALSRYYKTNFNKTPEDAMKMATHNLDSTFRSYFTF